jgi:hypothetical protein
VVALALVPAAAQPTLPHAVTDGLADLRTEAVREADDAARQRGRALLDATALRHGLEAWRGFSTFEAVAADRWSRPGPWWPQQDQRIRMQQRVGTFTSRVELLDGPAAGEIWGIQSWAPYRRAGSSTEARFLDGPEGALRFYLPSLHYFNELIFRLQRAPTAIDAGEATLGGRVYDRVFVTWGDPHPRDQVDHYVLWIARDSGLVEMAHYTVRDIAVLGLAPEDQRELMRAGAAGTIHYSDFRDVGGVLFPFRQVVTLLGPEQAPDPLTDDFVHLLEVESAGFDGFTAELLTPDPARGAPADTKPGG